MAISPRRVPVGDQVARLDTGNVSSAAMRTTSLLVKNRGGVAVYLGDGNVDTATGFQVDPGESVSVDIRPTDGGLYAIAGNGQTATCHVLIVGAP